MIQVTPQMRVLVAVEPADFRKGIDGLSRVVKQALHEDPFSGAIFVFRNRRASAIKILVYDGQGYWLCQKRLSAGRFRFWPRRASEEQSSRELQAAELSVLLSGGDFQAVDTHPLWRRVSPG